MLLDNSLYRLLRFGDVICMKFLNNRQALYTMRMGAVYSVESIWLYENEKQLDRDFNDTSLASIDIHIYCKDQQPRSFNVWTKTNGYFDWSFILDNMKSIRKEIGFVKPDLFKHTVQILPLKVLCAKTYMEHFGIEACHDVQRVMDYETQQLVLKKQVWWV